MKEFLHELGLLLEWVEGTDDIDQFEKDFNLLVRKHKDVEEVYEIAEVIAHNYICTKHNRKEALVTSLDQWRKSKDVNL